jgi:hypothetical protein
VTTAPSELLTALSCSALLSSSLEGSSASSLAGCSGGKDGSAASFVSSITSSSSSRGLIHSKHIGWRPFSAAAKNSTAALDLAAAGVADKLPLWRFLRQQGFSEDSMSRLQAAASSRKAKGWGQLGNRTTEQKLQRDLAPNIAALRADGLDTPSIERLFLRRLKLLTTTHATFSSALAAMRRLAALLPDDPRAVQAPLGATQLGVALWLYPTASARMLARANLASLIEGSLRLRRQLGISDAAAAGLLKDSRSALVTNVERAEAMVAYLQRLQASGQLSARQAALTQLAMSSALRQTPVEFERRWREGGTSALDHISCKDPAGRQRAAADTIGELLQAADGMPGPLQQQYQQQGEALVHRSHNLWAAGQASLRASWASLQQLGLSNSQVVAVAQAQPSVLATDWQGEAKQRQLAWVQQELGLSPVDFLLRHGRYCTYSVATIAMRASFLQQHRPAVFATRLARGSGLLLSLLTHRSFLKQASCTAAELAAFKRAWLTTPAGRRWGSKVGRSSLFSK